MALSFMVRSIAWGIVFLLAGWVRAESAENSVADSIVVHADDWPWWRGPSRVGIARADQDPPTQWSQTENVVWKSDVPGRGHSSPILWKNHLFLTTADEKTGSQSVLAYDRATGRPLWQSVVHETGLMKKNQKSSGASSSAACDGERVFVNFANNGAVWVTALDLEGKKLWQTPLCDYKIHQGYGASPTVYRSLVIVAADSHAGGAVAGLDRATGNVVWKHDRPKLPNYTSPILLRMADRDQLVMTGCNAITSLDPGTGKLLWETKGGTTESVTSTVTDGSRVFSSGGYPKNHLAGISNDGSGKIVWETKERVYVPSLLVVGDHLFGLLDAGMAACWDSATGQSRWKKRLRGEFSASPVLVGNQIFATNEVGETFIFRANPEEFEEVAVNKLGDQVMATPTICGGQIFMRVAHDQEGPYREVLYCLGKSGPAPATDN